MNYEELYEYYLILFMLYNGDNEEDFKETYDIDEIYTYLFSKLSDQFDRELDLSSLKDREDVYNYLNSMFKYRLLSNLLKDQFNELTNEGNDRFILENITPICDIVTSELNKLNEIEMKEKVLPKISLEELDNLLIEYLLSIDPNGDYLELYEKIKIENKILFLSTLSEEQKEKLLDMLNIEEIDHGLYLRTVPIIIFDDKEDISDIKVLAHDIIRFYIDWKNGGKETHPLIDEFPSIFYDTYLNKFLLQKGYSEEDINQLNLYRPRKIKENSNYLSKIIYYLKICLNKGFDISEEDDIKEIKRILLETSEKDMQNIRNPKDIACINCDATNIFLSNHLDLFISNFRYLINNYLASHYLEKVENEEITLERMKELANNLPDISPSIIIETKEEREKRNKDCKNKRNAL